MKKLGIALFAALFLLIGAYQLPTIKPCSPVTCDVTFRGDVTVEGTFTFSGSLAVADDENIGIGTDSDAIIQWDTAETIDTLKIGVDTGTRSLVITEKGNIDTDLSLPQMSNPCLVITTAGSSSTDYHYRRSYMSGGTALMIIDKFSTAVGMWLLQSTQDDDNSHFIQRRVWHGDGTGLSAFHWYLDTKPILWDSNSDDGGIVLARKDAAVTGFPFSGYTSQYFGVANNAGTQLVLITASDGTNDIPTIYGKGAYLRIGDAGVTGHSLAAEDDLMVTGKLEVDGVAYFDTTVTLQNAETIDNATDGTINIAGNLKVTENSDYIQLTCTTTDAYIKWLDGSIIFETQEADSNTSVDIKGKGTGVGLFRAYDEDQAEYIQFHASGGAGFLATKGTSPGTINIQTNVAQDVNIWNTIASGNPSLNLYGYITAGTAVRYGEFTMDDTNDEFLVQAEDNANHEGITISIPEGSQKFRIRGASAAERFAIDEDGQLTMGATGSHQSVAAAGDHSILIYTTTPATSGNVYPIEIFHTNTAAGINNSRVFQVTNTLGANVAGPYAAFFTTACVGYQVLGLGAAFGIELVMPTATITSGEFHAMTVDVACPTSLDLGLGYHSFIKMEVWGNTDDEWNECANLFYINNIVDTVDGMFEAEDIDAPDFTHVLRINIDGTTYYIGLSTIKGFTD